VGLGADDGTAEVGRGGFLELFELVGGRTPSRLEAGGVPAGEASAALVGALAERERGLPWVACRTDGVVGEECQRPGPGRGPRAEREWLVAQSWGRRRRVGVEGGAGDVVVAGPESERDDLLRGGLLGDRIGVLLRKRVGHRQPQHAPLPGDAVIAASKVLVATASFVTELEGQQGARPCGRALRGAPIRWRRLAASCSSRRKAWASSGLPAQDAPRGSGLPQSDRGLCRFPYARRLGRV